MFKRIILIIKKYYSLKADSKKLLIELFITSFFARTTLLTLPYIAAKIIDFLTENNYKYAFYGIIPMFFYSIYYTLNILIHLNNGGLTYKYDFYGFLQGNINNIFIVIPIIYFITYLISIILIFLNKKNKLIGD